MMASMQEMSHPKTTDEVDLGQTRLKIANLLTRDLSMAPFFIKLFEWIDRKLGLLLAFLKDAEAKRGSESGSEAEERALKAFVRSVFRLAHDVDSVITLFTCKREQEQHRKGSLKCSFFISNNNWGSGHQFDKEIELIITQIFQLTVSARTLQLIGVDSLARSFQYLEPPANPLSSPAVSEEIRVIIGLEEDVQIVMSRLIRGNPTLEVISIVGTEGIGKTTLAKQVYNDSVIATHFPLRAWVTIPQPQEFETIKILRSIGEQVSFPEPESSSSSGDTTAHFMEKLHQFLSSKRYLIILEDVQTSESWDNLRAVFPDMTQSSSRVIITTRKRELVFAGPTWSCYIHVMRHLSEGESWELLNAKVVVPKELEKLGQEILRKCGGLPQAILAVAGLLSRKERKQDQWAMVRDQIDDEQVSESHKLKADADALPSNLKDCLLYLGYFHESYDIPARRLTALWLAEGVVQQETGSSSTEPLELEGLVEEHLTELIQQNMIQVGKWKTNGKVRTCRMNYLLRDQWVSKAKEVVNFLQASGKPTASSKSHRRRTGMIRRLADHLDTNDDSFSHIHDNDSINRSSFRQCYGDLRCLLSFDFREGPVPGEDIGNFLRRGIGGRCFKMLRVIDLEDVFRPKLPKEIGKLIQLRYLGLRWTYLENLPSSIGNLLNLQTLDLKHTYIHSLPDSLWKMQQLRHLYLSGSYHSRFVPPPRTNSSRIDIQTLWGAFVDEETPVKNGLDRLANLRKLGLACRLTISQQRELAKWIKKLNHLESLRLRSIGDMVRPSSLYLKSLSGLNNLSSIYLFGKLENPVLVLDFPKSLTEITLSVSGLIEDPMPKLEKLPNLRVLNLFAGSYTGKIMVCSSGGFPLLRVLKLWKQEQLEEWMVEEGALTILREVEIRSCIKLKMIPLGFKFLTHCRELKLTKMPDEFKQRHTKGHGEDWQTIEHVPSIIIKD